MSKPIIEVKNIGKRYNITHQQGGYVAFRDIFANVLRNPFKFAKHKAKKMVGLEKNEEFWALKNVSFDVAEGEVVGIIGGNGAGKSTLLKILSGITPPTEGEIIMRGKVASLLEVGTGFHPELTGRENIFLNGAILGMTKKEIVKKFDAIVAFSGVEKFLDTPVKHYSSGMYVRLAFSVAAHMEPDVLIVDEVLAVGDAEFQKKCMGKMEEVTEKEGRTILFVSHNLDAIQQLCKRTVLLENGEIKMTGETKDVIDFYLYRQIEVNKIPIGEMTNRKGNGDIRFTECKLLTPRPENHTLKLEISYRNMTEKTYKDVKLSVAIKDSERKSLTNITNSVLGQRIDIEKGDGKIVLQIKNFNLESGKYILDLFMATDQMNSQVLDFLEDAATIDIDNSNFYNTNKLPPTKSVAFFDFKFDNIK